MPEQGEETRRDWELVQRNQTDVTERLKVLDGWLYRVITMPANAVSVVFVPNAR